MNKIYSVNYLALTITSVSMISALYILNNYFGLEFEIFLITSIILMYKIRNKLNVINFAISLWIVLIILPLRILYYWSFSIIIYLIPIVFLLGISVINSFKARFITYILLLVLVILSFNQVLEVSHETENCRVIDRFPVDVFLCKNNNFKYFQVFSTIFGTKDFCFHCQGKLSALRTSRFVITVPSIAILWFCYFYFKKKHKQTH